MRRKDKEITGIAEIEELIRRAPVCRIGLSDEGQPYVVPMNFGYCDRCIYVHSAPEGRKITILQENNRVCFEVDLDYELLGSEKACHFSANYSSVIGFGRALLLEDPEEKRRGLNVIMEHYTGSAAHQYSERELGAVAVIKIEIDSVTGKRSQRRGATGE
jgi:nitroimidazol reductase NimA-like FMN-containing flavoprotein (pyridoxamine 5'-phosphate oxidase superfamily)